MFAPEALGAAGPCVGAAARRRCFLLVPLQGGQGCGRLVGS